MAMDRAGLLLRVDRADAGLEQLRAVLGRIGAAGPPARFSSLFLDDPGSVTTKAAATLRQELDQAGWLAADAEITWHGPVRSAAVARALGATRRSLNRLPARWPPGPFAVDLAAPDLARCLDAAWLGRMVQAGLVHLGLRGSHLPADRVGRLDELARSCGFRRYETLHWALAGHEASWLLDARRGHPIMGLGPSAYGRWPDDQAAAGTGWCWWRAAPGRRWREQVAAGKDGRGRLHVLPARDRAIERAIDGLRLAEGFVPEAVVAETGQPLGHWLDLLALERLVLTGRLRWSGSCLLAADPGEADALADVLLCWSG